MSVIFMDSPMPTGAAHHESVPPSRLLGLLDTAKAYPLLKSQRPDAVAGVGCVRPNTINDYGDYTITTEEVFRFDDADTLVFHIAVSNKTAQIMRYLPQSLMAQAGTRVFYQSITDGNGEIPPQTSVPIYFAITGTSDGGRNDISPRNDFLVVLHRTSPPQSETPQPSPPQMDQPLSVSSLPVPTTIPPLPSPTGAPKPVQVAVPPSERTSASVLAVSPSFQSQPPIVSARTVVQPASSPASQVVPPAPQPCTYYYNPSTATYYYYPTASGYVYYTIPQQTYYSTSAPYYYSAPTPIYYASPWTSSFYRFGYGYQHGR